MAGTSLGARKGAATRKKALSASGRKTKTSLTKKGKR
jgi:hypothetical protein